MTIRVAVNGFGRTGRQMLRSALTSHPELEIVAINDLGPADALARLFARDSVHGRYGESVAVEGETMIVGSRHITMLSEAHAKALPWSDLGIDVVIESNGLLVFNILVVLFFCSNNFKFRVKLFFEFLKYCR